MRPGEKQSGQALGAQGRAHLRKSKQARFKKLKERLVRILGEDGGGLYRLGGTRSPHYAGQSAPELMAILQSQPPKCCSYRLNTVPGLKASVNADLY